MVALADDVIYAVGGCIVTVGAACQSRYFSAKENDSQLQKLIKDVQRICCIYMLEREGLLTEQREELHKTIVSVGIEFTKELEAVGGPCGDELRKLVTRVGLQTKLESELQPNLDNT